MCVFAHGAGPHRSGDARSATASANTHRNKSARAGGPDRSIAADLAARGAADCSVAADLAARGAADCSVAADLAARGAADCSATQCGLGWATSLRGSIIAESRML